MPRELPILFTAPLIREILAGRKTQTRRVVKPAPQGAPLRQVQGGWSVPNAARLWRPPGEVGDTLWVRETWRPMVAHSHAMDACDCGDVIVTYAADGEGRFFSDYAIPAEWVLPRAAKRGDVPSLHMPRWAARIFLEVTSVRAERLWSLTEHDARAEGFASREDFAHAWSAIYGTEDWMSRNPMVWVLTFRRREA